jgi:hypothetical protein
MRAIPFGPSSKPEQDRPWKIVGIIWGKTVSSVLAELCKRKLPCYLLASGRMETDVRHHQTSPSAPRRLGAIWLGRSPALNGVNAAIFSRKGLHQEILTATACCCGPAIRKPRNPLS